MPTSQGALKLPQTTSGIVLSGRQSKVILTDYTFGAHGSVLYSTASVFFAGTIGGRDILFLFGDADQSHEAALTLTGSGAHVRSSTVQVSPAARGPTTVTVLAGTTGLVTVWDSDTQLVLFADTVTAASFWAPPIRAATHQSVPGFESFWQFGTNETVLVGGPYLVRNASLTAGGRTLALRGDLNASVPLTVVAPSGVRSVTWNGERVEGLRATTDARGRGGVFTGHLQARAAVKGVRAPTLSGWRFADSLPEVKAGFDDAAWVVADHTATNVSQKPLFGDGRVLYGELRGAAAGGRPMLTCRCRLRLWLVSAAVGDGRARWTDAAASCENDVLWRGHFDGTGSEQSVNLTVNGGSCAFALSDGHASD